MKPFENELKRIKSIIYSFEKDLNLGNISVENNLRRIQGLADPQTIMRKMQERDSAWIGKLQKDMMAISGLDQLHLMSDLIELKNKYPNELSIVDMGHKGIYIFEKLLDISASVAKKLNAPHDPNQKRTLMDIWDREFDYNDSIKYDRLIYEKDKATTELEYKKLAVQFKGLNNYKNSINLAKECEELAVKAKYNYFIKKKGITKTVDDFVKLADLFTDMNGFLDSVKLAEECKELAVNILVDKKDKLTSKEPNLLTEALVWEKHTGEGSGDNWEIVYNHIIKSASKSTSVHDYQYLIDKFSKLNVNDDSLKHVRECEQLVIIKKYLKFVGIKKAATTEERFKELHTDFLSISHFANSSSIAEQCDKKYRLLVKQREEKEAEDEALKERLANLNRIKGKIIIISNWILLGSWLLFIAIFINSTSWLYAQFLLICPYFILSLLISNIKYKMNKIEDTKYLIIGAVYIIAGILLLSIKGLFGGFWGIFSGIVVSIVAYVIFLVISLINYKKY